MTTEQIELCAWDIERLDWASPEGREGYARGDTACHWSDERIAARAADLGLPEPTETECESIRIEAASFASERIEAARDAAEDA
jgi:hypothetical protein